MSVHTRSQQLAQAAYDRIAEHDELHDDYVNFAKKFPALIHTCGLAQSVAFALAKKHEKYIEDLAAVLAASERREASSTTVFQQQTRESSLGEYLRLSRNAIDAASWLKRYVEAAGEAD